MIDVLLNSALPEAQRQGIPEWPARVQQARPPAPPPAGWVRMNPAQYNAHRAAHEAAQMAWIAAKQAARQPVPATVPLWKAKAHLETMTRPPPQRNMLDAADALAAQRGGALRQWWNQGDEIERDHPRTTEIATLIGITTPAAIDAWFRAAAAIEI